MLAAKTALCIRMDALGEVEGVSIGLEGREKVEMRLKQMETGQSVKASGSAKKGDQSKYQRPTQNIKQYNADSDVAMTSSAPTNGNGQADTKVKVKKEEEATNGAMDDGETNGSEQDGEKAKKKKDKKEKKRKIEEVVEPKVEEEEEVPEESERKKKKKKDKK